MTDNQPLLPERDGGDEPSQPSVFISYRREDSAAHAGRLYDELARRFGRSQVFTDVYNIGAGEEFEQVIRERLAQTTVFVAVIGPRWRGPRGWPRRPRIRQPGDFVRRELEMAREARVRILPVLVAGASLPEAKSLPDSIRFLNGLNASELRDTRWDDDVAAFARAIQAAHAKGPTRPPAVPVPTLGPDPALGPDPLLFRLGQWAAWLVGALLTTAMIIGIRNCDISPQPDNVNLATPAPSGTPHPSPTLVPSPLPSPPPSSSPSPTSSPGPAPRHTVGQVDRSPATDDTIDVAFLNIELFNDQVDTLRVMNVASAFVELNADAIGVTEVQEGAVQRLTTELTKRGYPAGYVYQDSRGAQDTALIYRRDQLQCARDEKVYSEQKARLEALDPEASQPIFPASRSSRSAPRPASTSRLAL
jgi:hypothetical protein